MRKPVIVVMGTRPEAIKLAPLFTTLISKEIPTILCATFQHNELLQQVFDIFNIKPDINLDVMKKNQSLFFLTSTILEKMHQVYQEYKPSLVLVQGDTTTTFAAALAAFYLKIPVGHVEAGLRSGDKMSPFPEEVNRICTTAVSSYHFAPTALSAANLLKEGVDPKSVFCTGNTVIDSLFWINNQINNGSLKIDQKIKNVINDARINKNKIVLITAHRRESFDGGLVRIFSAIHKFASLHEDITFIYPFHPNPHVLDEIEKSGIKKLKNINLMQPLEYKDLVFVLSSSDWIISDSGGIQEEAVSLGKPVIVIRDRTERPEGIWEGLLVIAGTDEDSIFKEMTNLYRNKQKNKPSSVYGDGKASERIVSIIEKHIFEKELTSRSIISQQKEICVKNL